MRFSDEEDRGNDHFGFRIADPSTLSTGDNFPVASLNPDTQALLLQYTKIEAIGNTPITYELSSDLLTWTTAIENTNYTQTASSNGDGTETITVTFTSSENLFLRVVVTLD